MAITNFDELCKAVIKWSHREDLASLIPDFVMLAEDAMYNNDMEPLKLRSMEVTAEIATPTRIISLPADFESSRSTRLTIDYGQLVYVTPEALNSIGGTGRPNFFTIVGDTIEFDITPDTSYTLQIQYYRREPALTDANQTNTVLTNNPAVYLNGALYEAMLYAQDFDQQQVYRARFMSSIKGANKADKKGRYGNAPAVKIDNSSLRP